MVQFGECCTVQLREQLKATCGVLHFCTHSFKPCALSISRVSQHSWCVLVFTLQAEYSVFWDRCDEAIGLPALPLGKAETCVLDEFGDDDRGSLVYG